MSNIALKLKLCHIGDTSNLNFQILVEVAAVLGITDEGQHFFLESVDVLKAGVEADKERNLFPHGPTASNILDVDVVEDLAKCRYASPLQFDSNLQCVEPEPSCHSVRA